MKLRIYRCVPLRQPDVRSMRQLPVGPRISEELPRGRRHARSSSASSGRPSRSSASTAAPSSTTVRHGSETSCSRFFSTLGDGAKKIGGIHDNFGVGAKIARCRGTPKAWSSSPTSTATPSMIWIVLDPDPATTSWWNSKTDDGTHCVIDPPRQLDGERDRLGAIRPDWVTEHGTDDRPSRQRGVPGHRPRQPAGREATSRVFRCT